MVLVVGVVIVLSNIDYICSYPTTIGLRAFDLLSADMSSFVLFIHDNSIKGRREKGNAWLEDFYFLPLVNVDVTP